MIRTTAKYSVIHTVDNGGLARVDFRDCDSAREYAKGHGGAVVQNDISRENWDILRWRALSVGIVLTAVSVLSAVAWGWIGILCWTGMI